MYITPISYVGHIRSMSYDPIKKQSSSGSLALGSLAAALMGQTSPMLASGSGSLQNARERHGKCPATGASATSPRTPGKCPATGASVSSSYLGSKNKNKK